MPTVGEQLASAREAKEWSLEDVARLTKLRSDQVLALEEGRFHIFSAPVYVRGFVKSYAKLVHLDPVPLIEQLNTEINKDKKTGPSRIVDRTGTRFRGMVRICPVPSPLAHCVAPGSHCGAGGYFCLGHAMVGRSQRPRPTRRTAPGPLRTIPTHAGRIHPTGTGVKALHPSA